MKPELEKLCTEFIANRDIVKQAIKWGDSDVYSACANIFCACGKTADVERLKECSKVIENQTGLFSKFRGKNRSFLCCMLALENHPEDRMLLANEYYQMLKMSFKDTEYLALTAFLLAGLREKPQVEEKITRGKEIYKRMNKEHPILTDDTDSVFAMALAFSDKDDEELIGDLETCYKALKAQFSSSGSIQTAAQILSMAATASEEKTQRMIDLYHGLLEADVKYGQSSELAPLAALSLADVPIPVLVKEIKEADEFLKSQKGYESGGVKKEQRALHAVMIVSDQYAGTNHVNTTVMTNALDMMISKQRSMLISLVFQTLQVAGELLAASVKDQDENAGSEAEEKQPQE